MQTVPPHSGDLSQDSAGPPVHPKRVTPPHAAGKRFYNALSASSVGLELGISVVIGLMFGMWLDGKWGSQPWAMLGGLVIGLVAGFRGVMRAVRRADRADQADAHDQDGDA